MQILDCTSFVSLLLARHSPQAASGSQGKRFFTSFRMTKGLDSDAACGARLRASAGQGCGPHGSKEPKNDATTIAVNHCSAPSAAFLRAIAPCACCGLPQHVDGCSDGCRRRGQLLVVFAGRSRQRLCLFFAYRLEFGSAASQPQSQLGFSRALRPSICRSCFCPKVGR